MCKHVKENVRHWCGHMERKKTKKEYMSDVEGRKCGSLARGKPTGEGIREGR